ncbi:MAG: hypothetical protein ACOC1I_04450 [Spirochaetota bacterium]
MAEILATIRLFTIVWHWNAFFDGLIYMNRTEDYPLQTYIRQFVVTIDPNSLDIENMSRIAKVSDRTLNAAKIVVTTLPVLLLYPLLQRFFISGIMLGSVKEWPERASKDGSPCQNVASPRASSYDKACRGSERVD